MATKGLSLDDDVKNLIGWLLKKHAQENADWKKYEQINARLSFTVANRGLAAFGLQLVDATPLPETKKK